MKTAVYHPRECALMSWPAPGAAPGEKTAACRGGFGIGCACPARRPCGRHQGLLLGGVPAAEIRGTTATQRRAPQ